MLAEWKLNLLKCNQCGKNKLEISGEKIKCKNCDNFYLVSESGILSISNFKRNEVTKFYDNIKGAILFERANVKFTRSYFETKVYKSYLEKYVQKSKDVIILDFGCGDGRFVDWFLKNDYKKIIALDSSKACLERLKERLSEEQLKNVFLVHSDMLSNPLKQDSFDFILAIEALYYLNEEFSLGLKECYDLLRKDGFLLNSEQNKEGTLFINTIFMDIPTLSMIYKDSVLEEDYKGEKTVAVKLRNYIDVKRDLEKCGFKIVEREGMSVLPVFISYAYNSKEKHIDNETEKILTEIVFKTSAQNKISRCVIHYSRK